MDDPEPDRLGPVATRQGTTERRGRRVVTYVGAAAAAAGLAAVIVATTTIGESKSSSPGLAAAPSASPIVEEPETPPGETPEIETPGVETAGVETAGVESAPVVLDLPGWSCGEAADEKMLCSSDAGSVVINWRPAREHSVWQSDPDKTAPYVGDVHGPWFVTVDGTADTSDAQAVSVGEALRWVH